MEVQLSDMKITDVSEQNHPSDDASGQTGGNPHGSFHNYVLYLLFAKFDPYLEACKDQLEIHSKCSYYLHVREDLPLTDQLMSKSALFQLIDHSRFQQAKKKANSQVKLQLWLLELLYEHIRSCRAELESMVNQFAHEDILRHKVEQLNQAMVDVDSALDFGSTRPASLISDSNIGSALLGGGTAPVPKILLSFIIRRPVLFHKSRSEALSTNARLYWFTDRTGRHEPGTLFEIFYKLVQPTAWLPDEGSQTGMYATYGYCVQINNLLPERDYEFTVKRADRRHDVLVYLWNDTLVLRTTSACPRGVKRKRLPLLGGWPVHI